VECGGSRTVDRASVVPERSRLVNPVAAGSRKNAPGSHLRSRKVKSEDFGDDRFAL